jgi:hypothetical protein
LILLRRKRNDRVERTRVWEDEKKEKLVMDPDAKEVAAVLAKLMLVDAIKERLAKDNLTPDNLHLDTDNVVEVLVTLVEGDAVIDDGEVHGFFRDLLDRHREFLANLEEAEPPTEAAIRRAKALLKKCGPEWKKIAIK